MAFGVQEGAYRGVGGFDEAFEVQEGACLSRGFERAPFCTTQRHKRGLARAAMPGAFGAKSPPNATSHFLNEDAQWCQRVRRRMRGGASATPPWRGPSCSALVQEGAYPGVGGFDEALGVEDQKGRPENTGADRGQKVATVCQGFSGRPF